MNSQIDKIDIPGIEKQQLYHSEEEEMEHNVNDSKETQQPPPVKTSKKKKPKQTRLGIDTHTFQEKKLSRDEQKALQIQRMFESLEQKDNQRKKKIKMEVSSNTSNTQQNVKTNGNISTNVQEEHGSLSDTLTKDIEVNKEIDMKGFDNMFFFLTEYQQQEKEKLQHSAKHDNANQQQQLLKNYQFQKLQKVDNDIFMRNKFWSQHLNNKLKENLNRINNSFNMQEAFQEFADKYLNQEYSRPVIELNYNNQ